MSTQYVGFGTLETWMAAIDHSRPVNADCVAEPGPANRKYQIAHNTLLVILSQTLGNELLYCRIPLARYQSFMGSLEPFNPSERNIQKRAQSGWDVIQQVLKDRGLTLRECLVAIPKNLKVLEANAECLKYDQASGLYIRAEASPAVDPV